MNHPNICTLHDVGHQDGVDYLVMEYLEGETLADRLRKGPLPVSQLLKYGVDICEGLERAHRSGVVHRDLKPGNIMLGKYGETLVVDWGLAKATGKADLLAGERLLTPGSGVGSAAIQIAKLHGARVIATTGTDAKMERARADKTRRRKLWTAARRRLHRYRSIGDE